MKNVCVFLSAQDLPEKYSKPAIEFARLLVKNNYGFVYGGSEVGLMKVAADAVHSHGGRITAVSAELFRGILRQEVHRVFIAQDITHRKRLYFENSDAVVAMPGGTGTLDEITDAIELKKWGIFDGPIVFLNVNGFWDGFINQLKKMRKEGFINVPLEDLVYVARTPRAAISYLKKQLDDLDY